MKQGFHVCLEGDNQQLLPHLYGLDNNRLQRFLQVKMTNRSTYKDQFYLHVTDRFENTGMAYVKTCTSESEFLQILRIVNSRICLVSTGNRLEKRYMHIILHENSMRLLRRHTNIMKDNVVV
jgi:hypothetical protein